MTFNKRWASFALLAWLAGGGCGGGGGGGGGRGGGGGGGGGGNNATCSAGQVSYRGEQGGVGDAYLWCISHANNAFGMTDQNTSATTNGGFTTGVNFPNLLNLTSASASGTGVEMPNAGLLVNPGTLPTGSLSPSQNVMAMVFEQSGYCPPSGTNAQFVSLPKSDWIPTKDAYGTVSLSGSNLTLTAFALDGSSNGSETDAFTCDPTTSLITFTDSKGKQRRVTTSPSGLFVAEGGQGAVGVLQASSNISLTTGDKYLGMLYEPATATPTTMIGFTVTTATSLTGFDPSTGNANGDTIHLGSQTSPGLFSGGTFVEGADNDAGLTFVANTASGKLVLWGITYDTIKNTSVNVLVLQQ